MHETVHTDVKLEDRRADYVSKDSDFPWFVHAYNREHGMMHTYGFLHDKPLNETESHHIVTRTPAGQEQWAPGHVVLPNHTSARLRRADGTPGMPLPLYSHALAAEGELPQWPRFSNTTTFSTSSR